MLPVTVIAAAGISVSPAGPSSAKVLEGAVGAASAPERYSSSDAVCARPQAELVTRSNSTRRGCS